MVFRRRMRYKRRSKYLSKSYIKSKKGSKSQANQIMSLQRQIKGINRKVSDRAQYSQYQITNSQTVIGHGAAISSTWQPAVFTPISPTNWQAIFQSESSSLLTPNKFRGRSIGFEHMIQINTIDGDGLSKIPVCCTLACVSLRKETALQLLQDSAGLTNFTQANKNYVLSPMGLIQGAGMIMINKGQFKVRYMKRFMLGALTDFNDGTPTNNLGDNNRRIYHRISYPNLIKSGRGDVNFLQLTGPDMEPQDHLIWLLFHNAYGTQTLSWHTNCVVTGRETN